MKKFLTYTFALLLSASAYANPVSQSDAVTYAKAFLKNVLGAERSVESAQIVNISGVDAFYALSLSPQGWLLISADDLISPIIGYSLDGSFDANNIPAPLTNYLTMFADDIVSRYDSNAAPSTAWQSDSLPSQNKATSDIQTSVDPLISVNWNQTGKYRQYCPTGTAGDALVGCVAVGMGQAMSVYQHPERPTGSHSYTSSNYGYLSIDYDAEDPYDWSYILSCEDDTKECARLLYHLGVSVDMDYGPDGSGVVYMGTVIRALKENFGYSNKVTNVAMDDYTTAEWIELLKTELSAGHPLIYSGYSSSGGHCFNVDGYSSSGLFHFNWGWAGSGNGYLNISSHDYNSSQRTAINFTPATGAPLSISLSNNTVTKGLPAGTVVGTVSVESDMDDVEWLFSLKGSYNIVTKTYNDPDFYIEDGVLKTSKEFSSSSSAIRSVVYITVTNASNGLRLEDQQFSIVLKSASALASITADAGITLSGSYGSINIGATNDVYNATIVSIDGREAARLQTLADATTTISGLASGVYIVTLRNDKRTLTDKVLVK